MAENVLATWHPEPLDAESDAKQLRALRKALSDEWNSLDGDVVQQLGASLKWIPLLSA